MAKPLNELRERLLRAGVAPRHVRRYIAELTDHLADLSAHEERGRRSQADAKSAALIRLGGMDDLAKAMIEKRQFRSWCSRAPWAMFGLVPLFFLAGTWFVALFMLWSGWQIFLPGADTPFTGTPLYGFENIYFQLDRALYFGAPILIGWGVGFLAARQRLNAIWPAAGLAMIAWMGGTAQVYASRTAVPGGVGHIWIEFSLGRSVDGVPNGLFHAMVILLVTVLPYLIWRLQKARSVSA
jgi:hypothetical protein